MPNNLNDVLNAPDPPPQWTETEMVAWLNSQPDWRRAKVIRALRKVRSQGGNPLRMLITLREEVERKQSVSLGQALVAFGRGWLEGAAIANGPAALRNLANKD